MFLAWFLLIFGSGLFYLPFHAVLFMNFLTIKKMMPEPFFYYSGWLSFLMAFLSLIPAGMFLKSSWDDVLFVVISAILVSFLIVQVGLMTLAGGLHGAI